MISIPKILAVTPGPANRSNATMVLRYGRKTGLTYGAALDSPGTMLSVVLSTIVCMVVAILNNVMYSITFSADSMRAVYRRWCRWIDGISAALFAIAGLALIRSAFTR